MLKKPQRGQRLSFWEGSGRKAGNREWEKSRLPERLPFWEAENMAPRKKEIPRP